MKIVNKCKLLTIFAKSSIIDNWQDAKYVSDIVSITFTVSKYQFNMNNKGQKQPSAGVLQKPCYENFRKTLRKTFEVESY